MSDKVNIATSLIMPDNMGLAEEVAEVFEKADLGLRTVSITQWGTAPAIIARINLAGDSSLRLEVLKQRGQYVVIGGPINVQASDQDLATALESVLAGYRAKCKSSTEMCDFKVKGGFMLRGYEGTPSLAQDLLDIASEEGDTFLAAFKDMLSFVREQSQSKVQLVTFTENNDGGGGDPMSNEKAGAEGAALLMGKLAKDFAETCIRQVEGFPPCDSGSGGKARVSLFDPFLSVMPCHDSWLMVEHALGGRRPTKDEAWEFQRVYARTIQAYVMGLLGEDRILEAYSADKYGSWIEKEKDLVQRLTAAASNRGGGGGDGQK